MAVLSRSPTPARWRGSKEILDLLTEPPKVGDLFRHKVERADIGEPVGRAAKAMLDEDFSQVPVYEGSN